ncbi:beta-1,3-galactosyltransferase 5-like [Sycon ciliatum]|uniref:beta-1,3-galactosyltransferase 5-like n=1 Tax=Sycon ciliatum TaxID=27933 RepID=UPI0020AB5432|eukprot:scpid56658/ scgid30574/ UDP-GlcNAc:betaGal beta-1,3-N-acetylglucosaminyltransferase 6; Core 3 synthase
MDGRGFVVSICFNVVGFVLLLCANYGWSEHGYNGGGQRGMSGLTPSQQLSMSSETGFEQQDRLLPGTNSREQGKIAMETGAAAHMLTERRPTRIGGAGADGGQPNTGQHVFEKEPVTSLPASTQSTGVEQQQQNCQCSACADMDPCCRATDPRKVVYLAIMCKSAPGNFERRQKMRAAWAKAMRVDSFYNANVMDKMVHFSFVIGKSGKRETDDAVDGESRLYNDTAVGNFKDTYQNLTSKLLWTLTHVQQTMRFRYLLMADDDAFINLNALIQWLVVSPNERFYSGMMEKDVLVVRDPESKWYVRRSFYGPETYPPYHQGFGYVTSCDSVEDGMKYVSGIPLFGIDDTVMGMLMFVGGVKASHMPRFHSAPYYCQKFMDRHPLVIGDIEAADYDKYTIDLLDHGCGVCAGKNSKPPKSSAG